MRPKVNCEGCTWASNGLTGSLGLCCMHVQDLRKGHSAPIIGHTCGVQGERRLDVWRACIDGLWLAEAADVRYRPPRRLLTMPVFHTGTWAMSG